MGKGETRANAGGDRPNLGSGTQSTPDRPCRDGKGSVGGDVRGLENDLFQPHAKARLRARFRRTGPSFGPFETSYARLARSRASLGSTQAITLA